MLSRTAFQLTTKRSFFLNRILQSSDYENRAQMFGFASKEDILKTVKAPNTILLDVRSPAEIEATGPFQIDDNPWFTTSCTPAECPDLEFLAKEMFPDKSAPIVIYCGSGKRASKAEEVLKNNGYETVLNAGGFTDLDYLKEA